MNMQRIEDDPNAASADAAPDPADGPLTPAVLAALQDDTSPLRENAEINEADSLADEQDAALEADYAALSDDTAS